MPYVQKLCKQQRETVEKVMEKHPNVDPCSIFDDPDPLLSECVHELLQGGLDLATACKASVALKKEFS
jgi:hypothetical protein